MMKAQCTNQSKWPAFGCWLAVALFAASAAQAQVLVPVQQPAKSPLGCNVYFSNISVIPRDGNTAVIQFDIGWLGSWRTDVNHDAAWVFFKYRIEGDETKTWRHVRLAADKVLNPPGYGQGPVPTGGPLSFEWGCSPNELKKFSAAGDTQFDFLVPDGADGFVGTFIRRADHGMGTASGAKLTVLWDLRDLDVKKDTKVAIKAYGIKMVYVADGAFDLGSGGTETGAFYAYQPEKKRGAEKERIAVGGATMVMHEAVDATGEFPPYRVTSSNAIPTGKVPGKLWARASEPPDGGEIPATFPNGYKGFYMMDRPIPQAVYACFLSSLPPELASEYHEKGGHATEGGWAGFIGKFQDPDNPYEFHHGRLKSTCTWWLSWEIGTSFAAWAGLRPMTELENEKALRGPRLAAPEECGSSFWGGSYGGARYNAHPRELEVTVATPVGLAFKGTHGSGSPTNCPTDWPRKDAKGTGVRNGQEGACGITELKGPMWCTSCRLEADLNDPERGKIYGFRGARTAPEKAKWNSVRDEEEASPVLQGLPAVR